VHAPSRLQDTPDLVDGGLLLGHEVQDAVRNDDVHAFCFDRQRSGLALAYIDVCKPARHRASASAITHRLRHVDANRLAERADVERGQ
jgi:hypothetical protein